MFKKLMAGLLAVLTLGGCASQSPVSLDRQSMNITITESTVGFSKDQLGNAKLINDNECWIQLKEYPTCLAHEIIHCFSKKNFHEGRKSDQYCYDD